VQEVDSSRELRWGGDVRSVADAAAKEGLFEGVKEIAGIAAMFVGAEEGRGVAGDFSGAAPLGLHDQRGQARVEGEASHVRAVFAERTEAFEQRPRGIERRGGRRIEPGKRFGLADVHGVQFQAQSAELAAEDFGGVLGRSADGLCG
jgi:hypothetical protein